MSDNDDVFPNLDALGFGSFYELLAERMDDGMLWRGLNMSHFAKSWACFVGFGAVCAPLYAQEVSPDWPCQQREVSEISQGQNWPFPYEGGDAGFAVDDETSQLIALLSLRRTTPEEATGAVEVFAGNHEGLTADDFGWIYAQILQNYNTSRAQLISGIKRYDEGQQTRSEAIDALAKEIKDASAAANPDFDKIDQMEVDLDWNTRIYNDREDALSFVCESPILIEKQAYAMAQVLVPFVPEE